MRLGTLVLDVEHIEVHIYSVPLIYMVLHHCTKDCNQLKVTLYYWFCTSSP